MSHSKTSKPANFSFKGFIRITRFWNLLIIVFAQYYTAAFLVLSEQSLLSILLNQKLAFLSLSSVFIAAAGYIINDYYDVKIDLINKPHRVIVGKILKRRVVMAAHTILNISGIGIGFLLSWQIGVANFLATLLLWLYSNQLKRIALIGNITVALLTALSILMINLLFLQNNYMVIAFALFAFTFTLIREIIKDMEDVKGDHTFGCRTFPVVYGLRKTKILIYILSMSCIVGLTILAKIFIGFKMMLFSLALIIPFMILSYFLNRADTVRHFSALSKYCKIIMLLGILSMALH